VTVAGADARHLFTSAKRELLARGLRTVRREDALPLHLVVCDELAFYLTLPEKRERQEFAELLRDLVARGRAAGIIVVAATQKPGHDVVPTAPRDLFGFRLAMRCNTPQATDTILGQGWASAGADSSTIADGQRGVGYLLAEGERPERIKTFHLGTTTCARSASVPPHIVRMTGSPARGRSRSWARDRGGYAGGVRLELVLGQVLERAEDPEMWERFERQLRSTGYCRRSVRLRGQTDAVDTVTGEVRAVFSTADEPDETLPKCCGNRREAVGPSCAEVYRGDAFQPVAAGLRGGKGVPESVTAHPTVFVTLTAPSFGLVHSVRERDGRGNDVFPVVMGRCASTVSGCRAARCTMRMIRGWASRSARIALTTSAR
jgi:S-DNA-T family DNA segregation ATPase FtsK/SpoIIIE